MSLYYNSTTNKYYNNYEAAVAACKKEMEMVWLNKIK